MVSMQNVWANQSPWKLYAEFKFGAGFYFYGRSESECLREVEQMQDSHGDITALIWITDDYYTDGQHIVRKGRDET